jgi:hypothetical protein
VRVGETYGQLTIVEVRPGEGGGRHAIAVCECACGTIKEMRSQIFKKSKSCGCRRSDSSTWKSVGPKTQPWMLPEGEAAARSLYYQYKRAATKRELQFDLTLEQFRSIAVKDCFYCGAEAAREYNPSRKDGKGLFNGAFVCNGIDRQDSGFGYTEVNSVPCCSECNFAKGTRTVTEFIAHAQRVASHGVVLP